jgi:protein disulfide isomerase family A protein 3
MKMFFAILFIASILSASLASDVLVFTDNDFESNVKQHSIILVEFYAPWCGHCKRLAPEYEEAATKLKSTDPLVPLAKVDCTAEKSICEKFGVSGYPTLKVFKNGAFAFEYEGGRNADGIIKYMLSKAGPSTKELTNNADFDKFIGSTLPVVVGFFSSEGSTLQKLFQTVADGLAEDFRFAHSYNAEVNKKAGYEDDAIVIFSPKMLHNKFEENNRKYTGSASSSATLRTWIEENIHGFAGVRTSFNQKYFNRKPLVIAYYLVDYEKNPKGTNYWRNRIMKVGKQVKQKLGVDVTFAVSNFRDMHDINEYGIETPEDSKIYIVGRDNNDRKYVMSDDFTLENFEKWLTSFLQGKLEAYLKSEPIPSSNDEPVKVVVAKNFNDIVNDESKDVLIEFYAPWCGHCKSLEPKYNEAAEKLSKEKDIVIAKMDATANDVPAPYEVKGFPTIYYASKNNKKFPQPYNGGREVDDIVRFIAQSSTDALKTFDRNGNKRKDGKEDL